MAAVVMAGTPVYALSQTPQTSWQDEKEARVGDLNTEAEAAGRVAEEKENYKKSNDVLLDYNDQVKVVMTSSESVENKIAILKRLAKIMEEKAKDILGKSPPAWDQALAADLKSLSEKINELKVDNGQFEEKTRNALLGGLSDNDVKWHDANKAFEAAEREKELIAYKRDRWNGVNSETDLDTLKKTYQLNAGTTDAINNPDGVLTWNDRNQIDFKNETAPAPGQTFIDANATLEITKRSGEKSDAITGAANDTREVGTIRAVEEANHTILVDEGTLKVHRGIEGEASLKVAVGTNGALDFVSGKGVDPAAQNILLSAGTTQGKPLGAGDKGGRIAFEQGTSAGGAHILVADHGELHFRQGADAGQSQIAIREGGVAGFDEAAAKGAVISNDGTLTFLKSNGDDADVDNHKGAHVVFKDTSLDRLHLKNAGTANLTGATTADAATIELDGGVLSLADTASLAADAPRAGTGPTLGIGSLSGTGEVITAGKSLQLGALNRNDVFGGRILSGSQGGAGAHVSKVGTGHLVFSADQSGIETLNVENGTLTAAHRNALGTGLLTLAEPATISLANDVYDVKTFENAGTLKLNGYKLVIDSYASKGEKAKILSDAKKDADGIHRGTLEVNKDGDFTKTKIVLRPVDTSVSPEELLEKKIQVVVPGKDAKVKLGEVDYGSIPTNPSGDGGDDGSVIIDPNKGIAFLDPNAPYSGNEGELLASLGGVTLNDIVSGRVGGNVLGQMVLLPAGSAEQRRAARMLSGESLANNATAAYGAADQFRASMQTRMLAGGSMPDCNTTAGQRAGENGTAVWGSFKGAGANQEGSGTSFSTSGIDGAFGVDRRLNRNALIGASFGLGTRTSRANDLPGDASVRTASVGLYGSYLSDARWFANGGVFFSNHNLTSDRTVAARDVSARVSGKTGGRTIGVFGELGQRVIAGGMNVDPFLGMRLASTRLDGYDETDRDATQGNNGLHVGSQTSNSRRVIAGVRLWRELVNTAGGSVIPSLRLAYEHEFGDTQGSLTNAIYGAPRSFTVNGVKLGRDIFTADLGADIRVTRQLNMHVGGNLSLRSGEKAVAGGVSAKYSF
uniref:Autotransporter domain-containing protein n=2 Tax=Pandoraea faecigallinarum TaxID=656179 RepID=A0A0H3WPN3_9BURK